LICDTAYYDQHKIWKVLVSIFSFSFSLFSSSQLSPWKKDDELRKEIHKMTPSVPSTPASASAPVKHIALQTPESGSTPLNKNNNENARNFPSPLASRPSVNASDRLPKVEKKPGGPPFGRGGS